MYQACWIGEDGAMACAARTKTAALRKFKTLMRADCGDLEARALTVKGISRGWLRDATEQERDEDWAEWFVLYKEKTPYPVWVYKQ